VRESHVLSSAIEAISQHSKEKPVSDEHSLSVERRRANKSARISQHRKRKRVSDGSSRTVERRGMHKSTQRWNERWALTLCGTQRRGDKSVSECKSGSD
jgi:hypothetical protein